MRGIVLAGGLGSRLRPVTTAINKHLLNVSNKPMIYYPMSTLMLAGIRDILIISTPESISLFEKLFEDGSSLGLRIDYAIQHKSNGIADAFKVAKKFSRYEKIALILGDNIFHGTELGRYLSKYTEISGAQIFAYEVNSPKDYGVIEIDDFGNAKSLEEKPQNPKSKLAVTGLYFFDEKANYYVDELKPSARGELEITDLNMIYLNKGELKVKVLPRGTMWLDMGTFENLYSAASYIKTVEERQGHQIACLEEISLNQGWIKANQIKKRIEYFSGTDYGNYLRRVLK